VNARRLLGGYRLLFCGLIVVASVQTLAHESAVPHVAPLAAAEILGALLLLARPTQWAGLALLLLVLAIAQLLAALAGEWPTRFLQYGASALLIVLMDRALGAPGSAARTRTAA
jgi:hypothetical protein